MLVRNRPEDIGLEIDGHASAANRSGRGSVPVTEEDWTLQEAMRTKTYWALLFCIGIPALVNTGITFHLISIMGENNISPALAAMSLSLMAVIGFPISILSGFILEKISANRILFFIFIGEILMMLLLLVTKNVFMVIVFGVFWGIIGGLERITIAIVWPNYFGRKHIGSIKGSSMTVTVIASAFGPLPFGFGFDIFHSYQPVFLMIIILPALGMIGALLAKKPSK